MHSTNIAEKTIDLDAIASFWERERAALPERNRVCIASRATTDERKKTIVVTCMDERNTHIDEALGFAPGHAEVYASGGGKVSAETFHAIYGARIFAACAENKPVSIFLLPHECSHDDHLGCAAFANDKEAQRAFFTDLKKNLSGRYPNAEVHVAAFCTTTHKLRDIDIENSDVYATVQDANTKFDKHAKDVAHAGHGIYVGDAYRAWVPERNNYFRLSSQSASIESDALIALTVMEHHSDVDLSTTPTVLHIDYPIYADAKRTEAARENMDACLETFLMKPGVAARLANGRLKMMKTETDMATWQGKTL